MHRHQPYSVSMESVTQADASLGRDKVSDVIQRPTVLQDSNGRTLNVHSKIVRFNSSPCQHRERMSKMRDEWFQKELWENTAVSVSSCLNRCVSYLVINW